MRDRLFTVIDGEPIIEAPFINLEPFKKLWDQDKSDDKSQYKKWLLYLYYTCDYRSEYYNIKNKQEIVLDHIFGPKVTKIPPIVLSCQEAYMLHNTIPEQRSLEAAVSSADSLCDTIKDFQQDSTQMTQVLSLIEREIDNSIKNQDLEDVTKWTTKKLELQEKYLNLASKAAALVPAIEKSVVTMISLRKKVEESIWTLDESGSKLEDYIIDEFIAGREKL